MAKNQKSNEEKTNVMRILDGKKINYKNYGKTIFCIRNRWYRYALH